VTTTRKRTTGFSSPSEMIEKTEEPIMEMPIKEEEKEKEETKGVEIVEEEKKPKLAPRPKLITLPIVTHTNPPPNLPLGEVRRRNTPRFS